jgi:peptidylprolyl isomerase
MATKQDPPPAPAARVQVFFEVEIDGSPIGRITFELFNDKLPLTCDNFRSLCTGEKGKCRTMPGRELCFRGCVFHRIIPSFLVQGGDIIYGNGTGGESIYGGRFPDEGFPEGHSAPGALSMANAGPDTNSSQFFITVVKAQWLDGKHVVFGRVAEGMDVVRAIEHCGTKQGQPTKVCKIVDCGQIP